MGYLHRCLMCGEKIDSDLLECPCCGEKQYGENNEYNEYYPDEESINAAKMILQGQNNAKAEGFFSRIFGSKKKKEKQPMFSEEECFLYGIHPKDEMYRKTMELDILSKNYKE